MTSLPLAALNSVSPERQLSADGDDGRPFWKSFDELAETPEFLAQVKKEFPQQAGELTDVESRRRFLKLMAASISFAGLSGCLKQPSERIVPYVKQPEDFVPGKPLYYATCTTHRGFAAGTLVESHLGRPTKIEGNPEHPASLGAADAITQASILSLYDPDRSQAILSGGQIHTWGEFLTSITRELNDVREKKGGGLAILTETVTSPTLADQLKTIETQLPNARWYQYEPLARDNVYAGATIAFGQAADTVYHFELADVVLSLDGDFMTAMPGSLRYARQFADRRRIVDQAPGKKREMNRLYVIESTPTITGAAADHRLAVKASEIGNVAMMVAARLGIVDAPEKPDPLIDESWLKALVSDLESHRGRCLIVVGEGQPADVHALAHAINRHLDNFGKTVEQIEPVVVNPVNQVESIKQLIEQMNSGGVTTLVVLGGNPIYHVPGELGFASAYDKVPFRVHLSDEYDETSFVSHWHVPVAHELESWGDARAFDGTITIRQPLIAPLYAGRTPYELLSILLGRSEFTTHQLVRGYWKKQWNDDDFERRWNRAVHDGLVPDSRSPAITPEWKFTSNFQPDRINAQSGRENDIEITINADPSIADGRYANNGWLQELPKPLTKITWENVALISPRTAKELKIANREIISLTISDRIVEVPAWIMPGQADRSIALTLGYGRTVSGRIGKNLGVNINPFRSAGSIGFLNGIQIRGTGRRVQLAVTQNHHSMEGRDLIKSRTLAEFEADADFIEAKDRHPENQTTLYPPNDPAENQWGMTIDQTACIGCNACVIACQAENNIPIVGKEQVAKGREMHWLRIDRYYRGDIDLPETYFQPMMCVHCEKAPCELVCPVAATVHSQEGLNQMVYNRCVGTRYCSNNCPYKVRRFNFLEFNTLFDYDDAHSPSLSLQRNPNVTVRSRGVMEKCTYCIQRINHGKFEADKAGREVRDGEIVTACQQTCPTRAITFGRINDPNSRVSHFKQSPLNYSVLAELNTLPRTTHLARIQNPHPDLDGRATIDTPPIEPTVIDQWLLEQHAKEESKKTSAVH